MTKPIELTGPQAQLLALVHVLGEMRLGPGEGPIANALIRKKLIERLPFPASQFVRPTGPIQLVPTEEK